MTYQCIVKIINTSSAKSYAIVMVVNKQLLLKKILNSPSNDQAHQLTCLSLVVLMVKFSTLAFPNCQNSMFGSKYFVCSGMGMIDSIMTLKHHSSFKYAHGSKFPRYYKESVCLEFVNGPSKEWCGSRETCVGQRKHGEFVDYVWSRQMFEGPDQHGLPCVQ